MNQEASNTRSYVFAMLIIIVVSFGLRFGAMLATGGIEPLFDEQLYLQRADALLDGDGFVGSYQSWVRHKGTTYLADLPQYTGSYQPPFYTLFVAAVFAISDHSVAAVKFAQTLVGTATIGLVFWIASAWFDKKTALLASAYCAIYPNLIAFSHYIWTETVFIFLVLLAIGLLTTTQALPSKKRCITAGILLGFAALTRAAIFYFTPLLLLWLILVYREHRYQTIKRVALTSVALCATLAPWTIRNYYLHDALVLIDTNGPFNVWRGNAGKKTFLNRPHEPKFSYAPPFQSIPLMPVRANRAPELVELAKKKFDVKWPTDIQMTATAKEEAIKSIKSDPGYFIHAAWFKLIDMWNPTSFLVRHFRLERYGPVNPQFQQVIEWAAILTYVLATWAAIPGALMGLKTRMCGGAWPGLVAFEPSARWPSASPVFDVHCAVYHHARCECDGAVVERTDRYERRYRSPQ